MSEQPKHHETPEAVDEARAERAGGQPVDGRRALKNLVRLIARRRRQVKREARDAY